MAGEWHYQLFGEEFGPVNEDTLRELIAQGTLAEDDPVRRNGGRWQPVGEALSLRSTHGVAISTAVAPAPGDDSAADDNIPEWYCQVLGQELGPLTFDELLRFAEGGELSADDQVRFGATGKWRRVGSMGRLVSVLPYQNSSVTRVGKKKSADKAPVEAPAAVAKPAAPQISYAPAASELAWYAWIRGVEYGPNSLLQLQQYLTTGQLAPTDFVKYGVTGAWCPPSTVTQMLAQYTITVPAPVSPTATPAKAIPTVSAPVAKKPSQETISTVTAAKPATANVEAPPPAAKPVEPPAAKIEPPREEPVSKPTPAPMTPPASSTSSYGSSTSNWQARTVTAPPKPAPRPAKSSGGGMSFDVSALTSLIDVKSLGIGGGVIAVAALIIGVMYMPAGQGVEVDAFKQLQPLYLEFQKIRENKGSDAEVTALGQKVSKICPPLAKQLESRASVSRPASQKLFWVAKYRMNEMIAKGATTRSAAEIECERMLYDVSQVLKLPMDEPKPVETAGAKGTAPAKGPASLD